MTDRAQTRRLYYLKRITGVRWCILQLIDLLTHNGSPFDVRVSVQRTGPAVAGLVWSAGRQGSCLSNVYQGGRVMRLTDLFRGRQSRAQVQRKCSQGGVELPASCPGLPHLADAASTSVSARNGSHSSR